MSHNYRFLSAVLSPETDSNGIKYLSREITNIWLKFYRGNFDSAFKFWQHVCVEEGVWPTDSNNKPIGYKSLMHRQDSVGLVAKIAHRVSVMNSPSNSIHNENLNIDAFSIESRILFLFALLTRDDRDKLLGRITSKKE